MYLPVMDRNFIAKYEYEHPLRDFYYSFLDTLPVTGTFGTVFLAIGIAQSIATGHFLIILVGIIAVIALCYSIHQAFTWLGKNELRNKVVGQHYNIPLNSAFDVINDNSLDQTIAFAYGYADDFQAVKKVFGEYYLNGTIIHSGKRRIGTYREVKPGDEFWTEYGFKIRVNNIASFSHDDQERLCIEIIDLRRLQWPKWLGFLKKKPQT